MEALGSSRAATRFSLVKSPRPPTKTTDHPWEKNGSRGGLAKVWEFGDFCMPGPYLQVRLAATDETCSSCRGHQIPRDQNFLSVWGPRVQKLGQRLQNLCLKYLAS